MGILLSFVAALSAWANPPLVEVMLTPAHPKQGDTVRASLVLTAPYQSPDPVDVELSATLDGNALTLLHPANRIWLAELGSFNAVATHEISIDTHLVDSTEANQLREQITELSSEILNLEGQVADERDPAKKAELQAQLSQKQAQEAKLESELAALGKVIGTDHADFQVAFFTDLDGLTREISLSQSRTLLLQNPNDFGWPFQGMPNDLLTPQPSYPNQFGLHAQALLDVYTVTHEPSDLIEAKRTAEVLRGKTVSPTARLYATDGEFLGNAARVLGFPAYSTQAQAVMAAESYYSAAMYILNNFDPTADQVNGVDSNAIAAVTDDQRVQAFRSRLILFGRNNGLRAYDIDERIREALLLGDRAYALAWARVLAQDFSGISSTEDYYVLGLSNTISGLTPFVADDSSFASVIAQAKTTLLSLQQSNGLFPSSSATSGGQSSLEDQAYVAQALLDQGELSALSRLITALENAQFPSGAYDDGGGIESVESESELLSALSHVWLTSGAGRAESVAALYACSLSNRPIAPPLFFARKKPLPFL